MASVDEIPRDSAAAERPPAPIGRYGSTRYAPAPVGPPPGAGSSPHEALHWLVPVGRSWQSIVAGYLGLFSPVIWFLAPFSIGIGIWALVGAQPGAHGRGRAITGIVGGLLGAGIGLAVLLGALG